MITEDMEQIFIQLGQIKLWTLYPPQTPPKGIEVTEIRHEDEKGKDNTIAPEELDAWLADERPEGNPATTVVFRAVWVQLDLKTSQHYIRTPDLRKITTAFGLALAHDFFTSSFAGVFALPPQTTPSGIRCPFSFSYHPKLALLWSHLPAEGLTRAVFLGAPPQIKSLRGLAGTNWGPLSRHPMFPAFLVAFLLGLEADATLNAIKPGVREVEVRTRHHCFANRYENPAVGEGADLSARMSGSATKLAAAARKMAVLDGLCDFMETQIGRASCRERV